jgi:hypothetical protein
MSNNLLPDLARALATVANECCHRSDGWEEHLADRFEWMLREAFPPAPSSEAPTAAELEAFRLKYALGWTASENLLIAHLVAQLRCAAATPKES